MTASQALSQLSYGPGKDAEPDICRPERQGPRKPGLWGVPGDVSLGRASGPLRSGTGGGQHRAVAVLRFAVVSTADYVADVLGSFCEQLEDGTGLRIEPKLLDGFADLPGAFERGECELSWAPPMVAVELDDAELAVPLVTIERRAGGYHAALFSKTTSKLEKVDDIRSARVAWASKDSVSGYLAPRQHLASLGVDLARAFATERFCGTHEGVARAVLEGEADVGATFVALEPSRRQIEHAPWLDAGATAKDIRVLLLIGPIPADVLVVSRRVPNSTRDRVARALLALRPDREGPARQLFHAERFEPVRPGHFALLRTLAKSSADRTAGR